MRVALAVVVCALAAACSDGGERPGSDPTTTATTRTGPVVEPEGTTADATLRTVDGRDRTYRVYVPAGVAADPAGDPVPLLVALHGGSGRGTQFEKGSGFDGIAEASRFLVVYPDGVGTGPDGATNRTWNGGRCCGVAAREQVDDVAFVDTLVETVSAQYPVDPARVFAAGHSNGGILAYRLACELSDVVVAIGVQSASLEVDGCDPTRPVSVLHIHGTADQNLPIDGGVGPRAVSGVSFRLPVEGARTMAERDGCPDGPERSTDPADPDLTVDAWTPCADGTEVRFVTVSGAPHAWMGPGRPGAGPSTALDAGAEIWRFLVAHPRG